MKIPRLPDTGEWTTRRYLALLGSVIIWIIVAIDAWYLWPTQLGGDTSIVVVSGSSMEPTYFGGDLVIARKMDPSVGDVIVYAPEGLGGSQVVHRIIGGNADDGWQMQGDNNSFVDPFTPKGDEVKGVVVVHYANFGRVTVLLLNPMVWAFVLLAAMVMMLWWTGDDCDEDDDDSDATNGDRAPESEQEEEPDLIDRMVEGTEAAVARMVAAFATAGSAARDSLARRSDLPRPAAPPPRHASSTPRLASPAFARVTAISVVVGLLTISGPSIASASQLTVSVDSQASVMTVSKCADQTLAATASGSRSGSGTYSAVSVSGLDGACANLPVTVYLHGTSGTAPLATFSGTTPASGTTMTLSQAGADYNASSVSKVVVKINGWLFPALWSVPPVPIANPSCSPLNPGGNIPGGKSCTVSNTMLTQWTGGAGNAYHYKKLTFTVASDMDNFVVAFDFGDAATYGPWPAGTPTRVWSQGQVVGATAPWPGYSCSALPTVSLSRNLSGNLSINTFEILVSNDPSAAAGAGYSQVICP